MVLNREKHGLTSFGNLAATPHPDRTCTERNVVCVGILDEPINWGSNDVQVIILMSLSTDEQQDSRLFIETLTEFISDEDTVRDLINNRTFDNLLRLLMEKHGYQQ
ncbi:MAG: PTS sugar transporter subunit IIA, partial [Erysipelotrichaceae bacterium]|nr:PTS sugar transporter subunit IIA [Erysipelotrichaceae bacterium]